MGIEIRQLHPLFVGEISGMALSRPLEEADVQALWEAIDRYAVLVFHDQRLSDEQLREFAGKFGKLEIGRSAAEGGKRRLALPEIGDISNLDEEGRLRARTDRRRLDSLGNRIWHTDASYMPVPVVLGMLHAVAVPPANALGAGETEFADMRAAYDALPEAMRKQSTGLSPSTTSSGRAARSALPNSCPASARSIRPHRNDSCAFTPARGARRCICRRTRRTSSAGRCPRAASCSTISTCMRPDPNSSTAMNGGSATSSFGIIAARCIAAGRTMTHVRAICAARPRSMFVRPWTRPLNRGRLQAWMRGSSPRKTTWVDPSLPPR